MTALGVVVAALRVKVVRVTSADRLRLRALKNRIASVLLALAYVDAVESAFEANVAMIESGYGPEEVVRFLPLVEKLARITARDRLRYQERLREIPQMTTVLDMIAETNLARGKVEGTDSVLTGMLAMVAKGVTSAANARALIDGLAIEGTITRQQADAALEKLS